MKCLTQSIPDVLIIEPKVHRDERGFFVETARENLHNQIGLPKLIQHNHSRSAKGVLRGLHYQLINPQGKLVRCSNGKIFDVAIDIRKNSDYFGAWVGAILDDKNHNQLWVPPNFAHGFLVLSDFADVCYSCTNYYSPSSEKGIAWDDPDIKIEWPLEEIKNKPILSKKDLYNPQLKDYEDNELPQ